jgi:Fe-S-cluster containining protein
MKENDQSSLDSAKLAIHATKKIFRKMKQAKPNDLDQKFHKGHEAEFKKMDCLSCGNCCKTTSPIFRDADIRRISKHLRIKEGKFISDYLRMDEEQDYVLKSSPCSFLDNDNSCSIYDVRPLACREYPHTDRKNMFQVLEITAENSLICPAVARIVLAITSPKI